MGATEAADGRGFLSALFDFSFTSFVTTPHHQGALRLDHDPDRSSAALAYTFLAFRREPRCSASWSLIIGDPLFIIIVMAFWRLVLESFVVRFRIAEDVRALRERSGR